LLNCHWCVPIAELIPPPPNVYKPLKLVNVGVFQATAEALPKGETIGPDNITNEILKKMQLTGIHYPYLLLKSAKSLAPIDPMEDGDRCDAAKDT
jgi:hypothetical protein